MFLLIPLRSALIFEYNTHVSGRRTLIVSSNVTCNFSVNFVFLNYWSFLIDSKKRFH